MFIFIRTYTCMNVYIYVYVHVYILHVFKYTHIHMLQLNAEGFLARFFDSAMLSQHSADVLGKSVCLCQSVPLCLSDCRSVCCLCACQSVCLDICVPVFCVSVGLSIFVLSVYLVCLCVFQSVSFCICVRVCRCVYVCIFNVYIYLHADIPLNTHTGQGFGICPRRSHL